MLIGKYESENISDSLINMRRKRALFLWIESYFKSSSLNPSTNTLSSVMDDLKGFNIDDASNQLLSTKSNASMATLLCSRLNSEYSLSY